MGQPMTSTGRQNRRPDRPSKRGEMLFVLSLGATRSVCTEWRMSIVEHSSPPGQTEQTRANFSFCLLRYRSQPPSLHYFHPLSLDWLPSSFTVQAISIRRHTTKHHDLPRRPWQQILAADRGCEAGNSMDAITQSSGKGFTPTSSRCWIPYQSQFDFQGTVRSRGYQGT
jgi:hypothetical protein